jgi:hypothetical protein
MPRELTFRIGKGVNLLAILRPELRQHADRAAYFLDLLRRKTRIDGGSVRLASKHLARIMGFRIYAKIVADLEQAGMVTRSRSYRPGERSKSYALSRAYLALEKVEYRPSNRYLLANLKSFFEERKAMAESPLVDPILSFLHSQILRVNLDAALIDAVIGREGDADKRHKIKCISDHIRFRDVRVREDNQGRVYHPLTGLPRAIRRSATVDGEALCEIDVVSSQPLLIPVVYRKWLAEGCRFSRMNPNSVEKYSDGFGEVVVEVHHHLCVEPTASNLCVAPDSVMTFQSWCEQGVVYERLAEMAGWPVPDEESRASVKRRVFCQLLYADSSGLHRPDNRLAVAFRDRFPELFAMLCDAQQRTLVDAATRRRVKSTRHAPSGRTSIVRKSVLPFYMQRIESQIVVRGVVPRWMDEKPGRFLATIHDSLLVCESDAEDAAQILRDEFAAVGLFPQVKVSGRLVQGSRART